MATYTVTTGNDTTAYTVSTGARGPMGPLGTLTSYATQVETLPDYPATFPPESHNHDGVYQPAGSYATAAQGALADTALQPADVGTAAAAALIDDDTFAAATSANVPSAESVKAYVDNNTDNAAVVTALGGTPADSVTLSLTGGANKIPQYNADADLVTGPWDNDNALGPGGQVLIPRRRYLGFLDNSGNIGAGMYFWPGHSGGDEIVASSPRWAWYWSDGWQMGNPATAPAGTRDNRHIYIQPYQATDASADTRILESPPVQFTARYWDGAASADQKVGMQLVPQSQAENTENLVMRFGASISSMRLTGGTEVFSLTRDGLWHPGLNSDFDELTDAATVSYPLNRNKTRQNAYVVIAGARTIEFSGALEAGMRGTLRVEQGTGGNHTLALPANAKVANNGLGAVTLSTTEGAVDLLRWEYDGTWTYWDILKDYTKALDADVQAFLTATSIADQTQIDAISQLVLDLKNNALWSKAVALYPFVGGTSATHAVNLKSPGTYNITDNAAWQAATHNANGVTGNGTSAFGDTGLAASAVGTQDSLSLVAYCKTTLPALNGYLVGANTSLGSRAGIYRYNPSGTDYFSVPGLNSTVANGIIRPTGNDWTTQITASRTGSTNQFLRGNGVTQSDADASSGRSTFNLYCLANNNNGSATGFSDANIALLWIGEGISDAEAQTLETIVTTYQTALSRANP